MKNSFVSLLLAGATVASCHAKQRTTVQSILDGMVSIPEKGFLLSETELTQGQWEAVMGFNPSEHHGNPNLPVEHVSKADADAFIDKLNARLEVKASKFEFGLPTPAEWLHAARTARTGSLEDSAWIKENSSGTTHEVATKKPNALGLYDIQGNVWEWLDGSKTAKGERRGGSYADAARGCSIHRWVHTPRGRRYGSCGLRVAAYLRGTRKLATSATTQQNGNIRMGASIQKSKNDTNTETYQKSKNSVATIEGEEGQGTGFLCEMDGKKYFVTNRHVARQRGRMTAYFLDGKKMEFGLDSTIEVAENRDLVRFEIHTDRPCLKLADDTPNIGDKVEFYGNAKGGGVITVTAGKILAVGRDNIEIDVPIQHGNSGSPLVRVSDGIVIGVTSHGWENASRLSGDNSEAGTRYDPKVSLTRKFAVRFSGVTWNSVAYGSFLKSVNVYRDLCLFYHWMKEVCLADRQTGVYEYQLPDLKLVGVTQLNDFMRKIAKSDELEKKAWDRIVMMREKNTAGGVMGRYGPMELANAWKNYKDKATKSYKIRKEILSKVLSYCKSTKVLSQDERDDVVEAFDWQYRTYSEKYRMQLKGIFPKPNN